MLEAFFNFFRDWLQLKCACGVELLYPCISCDNILNVVHVIKSMYYLSYYYDVCSNYIGKFHSSNNSTKSRNDQRPGTYNAYVRILVLIL